MGEPPSWLASLADGATFDLNSILIRLLWVGLLLLVNAFFVAAEFAIVSVRRSRIAQLASEGNTSAQLIQKEQEQLRQFLSTTQLCITISSLALGWIGAVQVAPIVCGWILSISWLADGLESLRISAEVFTVFATFALLSYLQVLVGELIPKTLAIIYAEPTALQLIKLSSATKMLLRPLVGLLDWSSNLILHLFRIPIPDSATLYDAVTSEELQLLIASSGESGSLEEDERELLANVFEFGETVASEVMVPRTSIDGIAQDATVRTVLAAVDESNHARYPVIGQSLDEIVGVLHLKDVVGELGRERCTLDSPISPFIRTVHFEHENKPVDELLSEMQEHRRALVMVVDEFGGTAGLITVRDLVEEIVGRISDDGDVTDEPEFQTLEPNVTLVQAQVDLDEVNEELELLLPLQDDYQTLGGFLIYHMQKIPQMGERFVYENTIFTVMGVDGPRIDRIRVEQVVTVKKGGETAAAEVEESMPKEEKTVASTQESQT